MTPRGLLLVWLISILVLVAGVALGGCGTYDKPRPPQPDACAEVSAVIQCSAFVTAGVRGPADKGMCASPTAPSIVGCSVDLAVVYPTPNSSPELVDCVESCE